MDPRPPFAAQLNHFPLGHCVALSYRFSVEGILSGSSLVQQDPSRAGVRGDAVAWERHVVRGNAKRGFFP